MRRFFRSLLALTVSLIWGANVITSLALMFLQRSNYNVLALIVIIVLSRFMRLNILRLRRSRNKCLIVALHAAEKCKMRYYLHKQSKASKRRRILRGFITTKAIVISVWTNASCDSERRLPPFRSERHGYGKRRMIRGAGRSRSNPIK